VALLALALGAASLAAAPQHGRLFPPEQLGLLEGPDRDAWQRPERVMDALRIGEGSVVADLGAGGGWFTIRLARRVGIIDSKKDGWGPGPPLEERVEPDEVIRDAEVAGLQLLTRETFLRYQYMLVFGPAPAR
jgi:hypothetical protein